MANSVSPSTLPLADIHLQQTPGIWPLAWGWWLLIAAALVFLVAFFLWQQKRQQRRAAQQEALKALRGIHSLSEINILLKRAALTYYPRDDVAALTSERWMAFLDQQLPVRHQGFVATHTLWQKGLFSPQPISDEEFAKCQQLAERWLKHALPPRHASAQEAQYV
ncbi:DUF4381 domain-containing protein [Grimontia sp. NTOU-MAR1]|uniref:DUF4381 domain-containing protein n=1 Tax=Grimontia sp. NTOU-MAR1 TaxID=3111011 RepID=UPI002DB799E7|nr:DUF4381 domain-containing protein [Grimontia sp. NTOU-MAR1]WRV99095.1 DUF4381 domain-containing protein [Grimontia sp. NTOU-MAR1]